MYKLSSCFLIGLLTVSCAQTTVKPVKYEDTTTEGLRVYEPLPLLIVSCQNVQIVSVPNFKKGYALTFKAFLAKNTSSAKVTDGLITELSANLDDTGLLSLLQAWGEKALGAAKELAALSTQVPGGIVGLEGVWRLNFNADGSFADMTQIAKGARCPTQDGAPPPAPKPAPGGKPVPTPGPKPPVDFPPK